MRDDDLRYGIAPPDHRLPAAVRLGPVRLEIADLERSIAWYEAVLGLRTLERTDGFAALGAQGEGAEPLVLLHEHPGAAPVPRHGRLGLYHYAILLPTRADLGRFMRHIAARGERVGASDHGVSEALYLHDPDGLGIEVYADRPRAGWRHDERQLQMGTRPLDTASLLAEAGEEPWGGMPAGTVIGHIHLHVGDLERASAFYHDALGLDKVVWSYPGALFLSAGGYHHHLGLNTWARGAPPAAEGEARLLEWTIVLPTVEQARAALESIEAAGGEADVDAGRARDPWGVALALEADAPSAINGSKTA